MCGSLKFREDGEKRDSLVSIARGDVIPVISPKTGATVHARFTGHARRETLKEKWLSEGWIPATTPAISYIEGYRETEREFGIPHGHHIKVVCRMVKDGNEWERVCQIVTRDAQTIDERACHPRFPVTRKPYVSKSTILKRQRATIKAKAEEGSSPEA